jgi:predicted ATPase
MPGRHLSEKEKALASKWGIESGTCQASCSTIPYLYSLEIEGDGIRGITEFQCFFRYPITAICGPNGVGKSTILALSALAYTSPTGWYVYAGKVQKRPNSRAGRSNYTAADFFDYDFSEIPPRNCTIRWRYKINGSEETKEIIIDNGSFSKHRKPERRVHFLPLSRILPPIEYAELRTGIRRNPRAFVDISLDAFYLGILKEILGDNYTEAKNKKASNRHTFRSCTNNRGSYSAFNMGSGENALILLMGMLQEIETGGLVVIEEIEASLHPEAQKRLASSLIKICIQKNLQIICSTHSETFLDALPRDARLLITRDGEDVISYEKPSARYAMSRMLGASLPELLIFCEDRFAKSIIEAAIPLEARRRVKIHDVGDVNTVIGQGISVLRVNDGRKALCVLDGECTSTQIDKRISASIQGQLELKPEYIILPGNSVDGSLRDLRPEQWILDQLSVNSYKESFAEQFDIQVSEAESILRRVKSRMASDHHSFCYLLAEETNLHITDCQQKTIYAVVTKRHPGFQDLNTKVIQLLDG